MGSADSLARTRSKRPTAATPVAFRVGGPASHSAPWLAAVVVHRRGGGLRVVQIRSVGYALCGTGESCALSYDSLASRRLARREALELALDSFAYLAVDAVVVVLPPRRGERPSQSALYFSRGDLKGRLHTPLAETIGAGRPRVRDFEGQFYRFLETERPNILTELASSGALSDEIASALDDAITEFRKTFLA